MLGEHSGLVSNQPPVSPLGDEARRIALNIAKLPWPLKR
jgi:hypothetical protein